MDEFLQWTEPNGDCLEWQRCFNSDGYPRALYKGNSNGKVHRIVYELNTGRDITGLVVRHTCDNPKCINPEHLIEGTPTDNMMDRRSRSRTHGHVPVEEYENVCTLREQGLTYQQVADSLNIGKKRVEYILTRYKP